MAFAISTVASVIRRVGHMHKGVTRLRVFLQHLALAAGVASVVILPPIWALAILVAAVQAFLMMGDYRWRDHAPPDTRKD
jgi:hypothetical protein